MWWSGANVSGTIRLIFTYEGAETVNIDIPFSFSFPETQIIVESPITITGTVGTEIEPRELNVTINDPNGYLAFPSGSLPSGMDFVDNKIVGTPQNAGSGSFEITVYDSSQTTSKTIVVNYVFSAAQSEKTYVYTVSGAGTPGIDGSYYDTGETTKGVMGDDLGFHIYTNGTAKIEYMIEYGQWSISLDGSQKYSINWSDDTMSSATTSVVFGDEPAPIISRYVSGDTPEDETHDYVYTISGSSNPNVNGNYWDVRNEYQTFYDSQGNPVDSFDNATYMFDGIWTNGKCYMAFNGTFTQITEGTPLTQERLYEFGNAYPDDLISSAYTGELVITKY